MVTSVRIQMAMTTEGELPIGVLSDEQVAGLTQCESIEQVEVGQLVAIYSRGRHRAVKIEKVGKKRIGAIYTTAGAITDAQKIASYSRTAQAHGNARHNREIAEEYTARAAKLRECGWQGDDSHEATRQSYGTPEAYAAQLDEWAASAKEKAEEYTSEEALAKAAAYDAQSLGDKIIQHTNTTRKSAKIEEVFLLGEEQ